MDLVEHHHICPAYKLKVVDCALVGAYRNFPDVLALAVIDADMVFRDSIVLQPGYVLPNKHYPWHEEQYRKALLAR